MAGTVREAVGEGAQLQRASVSRRRPLGWETSGRPGVNSQGGNRPPGAFLDGEASGSITADINKWPLRRVVRITSHRQLEEVGRVGPLLAIRRRKTTREPSPGIVVSASTSRRRASPGEMVSRRCRSRDTPPDRAAKSGPGVACFREGVSCDVVLRFLTPALPAGSVHTWRKRNEILFRRRIVPNRVQHQVCENSGSRSGAMM